MIWIRKLDRYTRFYVFVLCFSFKYKELQGKFMNLNFDAMLSTLLYLCQMVFCFFWVLEKLNCVPHVVVLCAGFI